MIAQVDREGVDAIADADGAEAPRRDHATRPARSDEACANLIVANTPDGVKAAIRAMMERRTRHRCWPSIKVPTLVVHGVEDTLIPISRSRRPCTARSQSRSSSSYRSPDICQTSNSRVVQATVWRFLKKL